MIQLEDIEREVKLLNPHDLRAFREWFAQYDADRNIADEKPLQTIANIVLEAMRSVPPEAFANRPKDGASEHDHYLYGHLKRNS